MIANNLLLFDSTGDQCTFNGYDYNTLLTMSRNEDYRDLKQTSLVGDLGDSPNGAKVIVIIPAISKNACLNPEKAIYVISTLHPLTKNPYCLIVCQTCAAWLDTQDFYFAKTWFDLLPNEHKAQLQKAYLVHSGYTVNTLMSLGTSITGSDTDKIVLLDKLTDALQQLDINTKENIKFFPYMVQRYEELLIGHESPVTVFGTDLKSLTLRFGRPFKGFDYVPPFLSKLILMLESQPAVTTRRLFDIQADAPTLYGLIGDIENQGERGLNSTNVTGLVYSFRLLLDSQYGGLFGPTAYQKLKQLGEKPTDESLENFLKNLLSMQNIDNVHCIYLIVTLFENLLQYTKSNGLTLEYLGEVFGSVFFRPASPDAHCYKYINSANRAVSLLVKNKTTVFDGFGIKFEAPIDEDTSNVNDVTFDDSTCSSYSDSESGSGSRSYSGSDSGSGSDSEYTPSDRSYTGSDLSGSGSGSESVYSDSESFYSGSEGGSVSGSEEGSDDESKE